MRVDAGGSAQLRESSYEYNANQLTKQMNNWNPTGGLDVALFETSNYYTECPKNKATIQISVLIQTTFCTDIFLCIS